ncbi:DnaJ-like protein subfamily C member 9, partial [Stegodyphus mimosarum]
MGLIDDCQTYFGTNCLYNVLLVDKRASEDELKKAYRKASLLLHPDKADDSEKETATRKFQTLSKIYCILSDPEKRVTYDETGCIDDENAFEPDKDWESYWRLLFPKITEEQIDNFLKKYNGSEEEKEDLKSCYMQFEGDMSKVSECLIGYNIDDEDRYYQILNDLIQKNEIPKFPKFVNETAQKRLTRRKRFKKEAAEAEKMKKEMGLDQGLVVAIANRATERRNQFDDMMKNLEAKYAKK